ncbi:MAG: hypothetical protein U0271_02760 [Polyangiaceae bacterium]
MRLRQARWRARRAAKKNKKKTQLRVRVDDRDVTDAEAEVDPAASEEAIRARQV